MLLKLEDDVTSETQHGNQPGRPPGEMICCSRGNHFPALRKDSNTLFFFKIYFILEREYEWREEQRESERKNPHADSPLSVEPELGVGCSIPGP